MTFRFRKWITITITIIVLLGGITIVKYCGQINDYQASADFEPIETIYLVWSDEDSTIISEIAGKVSPFDSVTIFLQDAESKADKIAGMISKKGGNLDKIGIYRLPGQQKNVWIRDYIPVFMKNESKMKMIEFQYWDKNTNISEYLGAVNKIPVYKSPFYSLGGTREFNGKGTAIYVISHEMRSNKDFRVNRKRYEQSLKKLLNLKKIIWLNRGIPQDELSDFGMIDNLIYPTGSNNHIDEFCRFIAPDKIMISYLTAEEAAMSPILTEAKRRLDENIRILENSTDQDGKKFEIIPVPFAPIIIRPFYSTPDTNDFRTEVTSYMNFLITNNTVILPTYLDIDSTLLTINKEKYIKRTFEKYFPGKKILVIHPGTLNSRGGGIHCITAAKPTIKKKTTGSFKLRLRKKSKT